MPKSDAPRPFRMRRVVYSDTNIVIPIFAYRYPVFFMTRVVVDDMELLLKIFVLYDVAFCIDDAPLGDVATF